MYPLISKISDRIKVKEKNFKSKLRILKTKILYYNNRKTGQPILWTGRKNRNSGKISLIVKDAIKYKVPIIVETKKQKLYLLQLSRRIGKPFVVYTAYENLSDKKVSKVLLDCAGRGWEVLQERYPYIKVVNGFVYDN